MKKGHLKSIKKGFGKLRILWWKIQRKVNQKSTSLEEGSLTEAGE